MLLRSSCAGCAGRDPGPAPRSAPVCLACFEVLEPARSLAPPLHLDACVAGLDYDSARSLITSLKNGQRRDLTGWLADRMVENLRPFPGAVVTWPPTAPARRRARGFDQAELLARAASRRWGLPCRPLLQRVGGAPQAGRSADERRGNPWFSANRASPSAVVLVDDVATTGATLTAAARALRSAGSVSVIAVVAARSAGAAVRSRSIG